MALTPAEILSCFELLQAFWSDTGSVTDGFGIQLSLTELDALKSDITTRLDALDADAVLKVRAIVLRYDVIASSTMSIEGGSTGNVSGVTIKMEELIARLRQRLLTYVPVMHIADAIKQKRGPIGSQGAQIPFMRC